ncbi:MAG: leucine-rich repeat domain-containing protein [Clostridia bacterium]|nr:leucine-rich repeat domain-containing protein [Clostridia bacterium]
MKKNTKVIIALAVAIAITASVLVMALLKKPDDTQSQTTLPVYTLQPTTLPGTPTPTESWVDLNQIASNLASTTGVSGTGVSISNPVITNSNFLNPMPNTSVVYVDQNGNIVDINQLLQNGGQPVSSTVIETNVIDTPEETKDNSVNQFSEFAITSAGVLTSYFGTSTSVIIPAKVGGKEVTAIGANCFKNSAIERITIPGHIKSIGESAFEGCTKLTSVSFLNREVNVPIGNKAFKGCVKLSKITLPIADSIGTSAFEGCSALTTVDINNGTKSLGQACFALCTSLTKVIIRDTDTVIPGVSVFSGCNPNLRIQCYQGSDVETSLKNLGLSTAPITE